MSGSPDELFRGVFVEKLDHQLLDRIARKLLTHLRWKGITEAELLAASLDSVARTTDENQPIDVRTLKHAPATHEVFDIAIRSLEREEIVGLIKAWVSQEKIAFLSHLLEDQGSSINDITEALERFVDMGLTDLDLPDSTRITVHVGLLRRFVTDDIDFINTAKSLVSIEDFYQLTRTLMMPANSHGRVGGKSAGLFIAQKIISAAAEENPLLADIRTPRTWYIASDALLAFLRHNHLEGIYDQKYADLTQVRKQYPHVIQVFKQASFPPALERGLRRALDELGDGPLIVRSSSLLEDRTGASFSGKYKSLFVANVGSRRERLEALEDAVAEVYASIFGPDPIEYRSERNLLDLHEEMGIMIQQVVGTKVGRYFLPSFAGVAFSSNEFRWSPRIQRGDGLLRLVMGLGTRAVDRVGDDFPVLLAPGQPALRAATTTEELDKYSPRLVDVIDLQANCFTTVAVKDLLRECGNGIPLVRRLISLWDHDRIRKPAGPRVDFTTADCLVTFEGLAADTPFLAQMNAVLRVLREQLKTDVDLEFASDGEHLHLLQCRPQSKDSGRAAPAIPHVGADQKLFTARRYISNGRVAGIKYVVYVDPAKYAEIGSNEELRAVGRIVSRLNRLLPRRSFVLIGPGRWGSRGDIKLGVSVTYSDINNTAVLIELARQKGNYVPELSFGTHFFQDLVEADIRYLPLFPDEAENQFADEMLVKAKNELVTLLPEAEKLSQVVRVVDVEASCGGSLTIVMNGEAEEAIGYFGEAI